MLRRRRTAGTRGIRRRQTSSGYSSSTMTGRRALVDLRRGEHMKAGLALRLVTVRWLGRFLEDPLEMPGAVLDFAAGQLGFGPVAGAGPEDFGIGYAGPDGGEVRSGLDVLGRADLERCRPVGVRCGE